MGISFIKDNRLIYRFQSPFADMPCRVQDIDMFVPGEYLTNIHIREKLAEIKPSKYNEDLLFWMFYSNPNDHMQLTAADELIRRNWRFHKEKKIWISKTQNIKVSITGVFFRLESNKTYRFPNMPRSVDPWLDLPINQN